jgi:4-amino-4-deoxy-L-arabinose transferase-like glycosyltransferase
MIASTVNYLKSVAEAERKLVLFIFTTNLLILLVGLTTDLRFSDEIFHFWYAREWFEGGSRPVYNALVDTTEEFHYFRYYVNDPLWHYGLSNLMVISGPSKALAQAYQAVFFALLMVGTYLLAKELYGRETAWYAVVVVSTLPVFVSLSILLFIDVPVASLTPLLFFSLLKKRGPIFIGLVLASMFLMKRNSYFLVPSFVALATAYWDSQRSKNPFSRGLKVLFVLLLAVIINLPDLLFRHEKFGMINYSTFERLPPGSLAKAVSNVYLTESVTLPENLVKFLGICLPFLLILSIVRNRYEKKDAWLLLPSFSYMPFYFFFFKDYWAVRYLSPILPLLAIFVAKGLVKGSLNRHLRIAVILACFAQLLVTLGYVYSERSVTLLEKEALTYINSHVPEGSRILTPEEWFVSYYTGRPTLWSSSFGEEFYKLLWAEKSQARDLLDKYKVMYIVVQRDRIYDDASVRHYGGFPSSFVEKRLPLIAQKVWENESMAIWQVMPG